jgi:transcriptional regulator with XRE-family HTH domain
MALKNLFGKRLKQIREAKGLTQQQLAELCDLQTNSITLIEIGERAASFNTIELLAENLGVSYYDLFDFSTELNPSKEKLICELNKEIVVFDEILLKHIIDYSKTMSKLFKIKRIY